MTNLENLQQKSQGLPAIINHNNRSAVSARDLYHQLGFNSSQFTRWVKKNILNNAFTEKGNDWFDLMSNGKQDFVLSLDFAKRLAMMARTERGEQIRNYFLQCERQTLEAAKPQTATELLLQSVMILHAQETKISGIETRIHELESQATTSLGYYGIAGFGALKRKSIDIRTAAALGSKAKAACRAVGAIITTMPDPRFGRVNCYPEEVLESVFNDFFTAK